MGEDVFDAFDLELLRDQLYEDNETAPPEDLEAWFTEQARYVAALVRAGTLPEESAYATLLDRLQRYRSKAAS